MSSRAYNPSTYTSPDGGATGAWSPTGGAPPGILSDGSDSTYVGADPQPYSQAFSVGFTNDSVIPSGSTVSSVVSTARAARTSPASTSARFFLVTGGTTLQTGFLSSEPLFPTFGAISETRTLDANGAAWTIANVFSSRYGVIIDDTIAEGHYVSNYSITINFTLPSPTATTNAATGTTLGSATLNGSINPNGATATYPVQYKFQYGLTTAYGSETTLTGALTGSSAQAVSANISGLAGNTLYHFRVVAVNADVTVNGSDMTFTTGVVDIPLLRL